MNLSSDPLSQSPADLESQKGRFGWIMIAPNTHIPYIIRSGRRYCSVRIVEMKMLRKWFDLVPRVWFSCTSIQKESMTPAEAHLMNEINVFHCNFEYGRLAFTSRELLVTLSDVQELNQFLTHCYHVSLSRFHKKSKRCGFIRIGEDASIVPYTVHEGCKYLPLFYFEGDTEALEPKAVKVEGWALAYLKFCFRIQRIRNEFLDTDSCTVVSLEEVRKLFPQETTFNDFFVYL